MISRVCAFEVDFKICILVVPSGPVAKAPSFFQGARVQSLVGEMRPQHDLWYDQKKKKKNCTLISYMPGKRLLHR